VPRAKMEGASGGGGSPYPPVRGTADPRVQRPAPPKSVPGLIRHHADWLILACVVMVAVFVRLSFARLVDPFVSKDSQSYFLPAWDLTHGDGFVLGLRRTPGYPLFLALIQILFGPALQSVIMAQHLLGVLTAALTFALARLVFGRLAGLVAGLLVALSAPLIVYEHYVLTEALFTFAITIAMLFFVQAMRSQRRRIALVSGMSLGAASMVRPVGQALAPLVLAGMALSRWPRGREAIIAAMMCALGLAVALTPWAIRNRLVNDLSGTTTFGRTLIARTAYYDRGFSFYEPGWGDEGDAQIVSARKIVQEGFNRRQSDGTIAGRLRQDLNLGPAEVNAVMRQVALEAILRRPEYFLTGSLKFAWEVFVGQDERVGNHADEIKDVTWDARTSHLLPGKPTSSQDAAQRDAQRLLNLYQPARYAAWHMMFCVIGIAAAVMRKPWRMGLAIAYAALIHIVLSAALDGPQERYRYTVDPLISVLAAGGMAACIGSVVAVVRGLTRFRPAPARQPDVAPTR
jgi:4-amino-4-deoxy-L-arabinose transferase-like glycosyltransferase